MSLSDRKHLTPHKHLASDIIGANAAARTIISAGKSGYDGSGMLDVTCTHDAIDRLTLLNYVWGFVDGLWQPVNLTIPTGESFLRINDSATGHWTDLFEILIDEGGGETSPIFGVSTGFLVKKDVSCGGYVAANQGIVALGSGLLSQFDPPGAWLTHSNVARLTYRSASAYPTGVPSGTRCVRTDSLTGGYPTLYQYNGSTWVSQGASYLDHGLIFQTTDPTGVDAGYIYINTSGTHTVKRYNGSTWVSLGATSEVQFQGYFDTFEIRKSVYNDVGIATSELGHMRCANVTCNNINPNPDEPYGIGNPDAVWSGVMATTLYADNLKKLNGDDWLTGTGEFTTDITITKANPILHLKSSSDSDAALVYSDDSVVKMAVAYDASGDQLYVYDYASDPNKTLLTLGHSGNLWTYGNISVGGNFNLTGEVTSNLTMAKTSPIFRLKATSESNAIIEFYDDSDFKMTLGYDATSDILYIRDDDGGKQIASFSHDGDFGLYRDMHCLGYVNPKSYRLGGTEIISAGGTLSGVVCNANIITAGTVDTAVLGSGTADSTTFLRGDNTWATPASTAWNGGIVTNSITIQKTGPQLSLYSTSESDATILFWDNNDHKMDLSYDAGSDILFVYDQDGGKTLWSTTHNGDFGVYNNITAGASLIATTSVISPLLTSNAADISLTIPAGKAVLVKGSRLIIPDSSNNGSIGNSTNYFNAMYSNWFYGKNNGLFGCERAKSGMEWPHEFSNAEDALEFLTHECTKIKYHTSYDEKSADKIICTCGKSVRAPCPEHQAEWNDRYVVNTGGLAQAASYMVLEHAAEIAALKTLIAELQMQLNKRSAA